jgi:putative endonuclease
MKGSHVYFMANKRDGTLYVGVTADLARRAFEHREGLVEGFTKQHGLKRLVYYEFRDDIRTAIQREKTIKHWPRLWKLALIQEMNPEWADLYETLNSRKSAWRPASADARSASCAGSTRAFRMRRARPTTIVAAWAHGSPPGVTREYGRPSRGELLPARPPLASCAGLSRASRMRRARLATIVPVWAPGSSPGVTSCGMSLR